MSTETDTVDVWSDVAMRVEVGLERGVYLDCKGALGPGPNHRTFDLCRGVNAGVPRELIAWWLRKNRFLDCVKKRRIRIVESEPAAPDQPVLAVA